MLKEIVNNLSLLQPYLFKYRKSMFIEKYEVLFEDGLINQDQVFGVMRLKHLCR